MNKNRSASFSSSEESDADAHRSRGHRRPCTSKNALVARKNREKQKAYVKGLESHVADLKRNTKNLKDLLRNQITHIEELQSEIKYLKATLANATEIGALVKRIRGPIDSIVTGMPSTNWKSDKMNLSPIDWESPKLVTPIQSPLLESMPLSPPDLGFSVFDPLEFEDIDFSPENDNDDVFEPVRSLPGKRMPKVDSFSEHNYSSTYGSEDEPLKDIGVCLHVSNKKMSLEFCSKCNESALLNWARGED